MPLSVVRLTVGNKRDSPHVVVIEPWACDYTLFTGENLTIEAHGDEATPWFQIIEWEGVTQIYCEETDDFRVLQGDVELESRHNRQA